MDHRFESTEDAAFRPDPPRELHPIDRRAPWLPVAAARLLEGAPRTAGAVDLRGVSILLPGARAGRQLREALITAAAAEGAAVWLPRIVTPATFLRLFEGKNLGKQLIQIAEPE